jgi:ABC-type transport system substrate-binding protein
MKRKLAVLLAGAVLVAVACGGSSPSQGSTGSKEGGTLTTAIGIDPDTLDPQAQTTTTVSQIVNMMTEGLVKLNAKGQVEPLLATEWKQSPDGLTYNFTLRKGVKFQDGEPFNAQAVKFSFDRLLSPNTFAAKPGNLRVIKDVQVVDDSHVAFHLKSPYAPFLSVLIQSVGDIIAPESVNKAPNTPAKIQQPVGTGPYQFKERVNADHVTMTRFDGYWGKKPAYQTQVIKVVPSDAARESLVRAGQAEVAALPPVNDLPQLQNNPDMKVIMGQSDRTIYMAINTVDKKQPLLQKREVRQALNYAVNVPAIIKNVLYGAATPLDAPMSSSLFGYCKTGDYKYDPNKAKQLLKQAGAEGMKIKLMAPQGRYIADYNMAQAVAGDLRKVGLQVDMPNPMDWPSYLGFADGVAPGVDNVDVHMIGWAPSYLDASQQFLLLTEPFPPPGDNSSYYLNSQVSSWVDKANSSLDPNLRKQNYCNAAKQVWNDAPWIFLYVQKNPILTSTKVTGVVDLPNEQFVTTWAQPA